MAAFLCIYFPPVITVGLTTIIRKEKFNNNQCIAHYAVFTIIINGIMFGVLSFIFDHHSISSQDVFTTSFTAKYLLFSSVLAVVLAYVFETLRRFKPYISRPDPEDTQEKTDEGE